MKRPVFKNSVRTAQ